MSWFAELAGKAENLLMNLDEQTGAALRSAKQKKCDRLDYASNTAASPRRRPIPRNIKKLVPDSKPIYSPSRKSSPTSHLSPTREPRDRESTKCPIREKSPKKLYNLHHSPKTLVGDVPADDLLMDRDCRERRYSLPSDVRLTKENLMYGLENLDIENTMLRNELNVVNREVSELLSRLRKTEDDLKATSTLLEDTEYNNQKLQANNKSLLSQLNKLKDEMDSLQLGEIKKNNCKIEELASEIAELKDRNGELEDEIRQLKEKCAEKDNIHLKLENDLRHGQSSIKSLQSDLDKSNGECKRLENDWETYKHRVKGMLSTKDNEIKALKDGMNLADDTNTLVVQIENLKEERELLSNALARGRGECDDLRRGVSELEARNSAAERVVLALREALKDERAARNRVEAQCGVLSKELKSIQIETGQTIASLRTSLRDKEYELNHLKESTSSVQTPNTSALNVADYDASDVSMDTERVYQLTQKLVQRQGRVDSLLADNNMLRIQLEKFESKYKTEMQSLRGTSHSVVNFQDGDRNRVRSNQKEFLLATMSRRMGVWIQRNPLFRIFIIIYMIGLHIWVLTVLLTSTPENNATRPAKS